MMEINDDKNKQDNKYRDSQTGDEESSYSSFYSSFLKTDTGSGSNDDSINTENRTVRSNEVSCIDLFLYFIFSKKKKN